MIKKDADAIFVEFGADLIVDILFFQNLVLIVNNLNTVCCKISRNFSKKMKSSNLVPCPCQKDTRPTLNVY